MRKVWCTVIDGTVDGFFSTADISKAISEGRLSSKDLVWKKDLDTWEPAVRHFKAVFELKASINGEKSYSEPLQIASTQEAIEEPVVPIESKLLLGFLTCFAVIGALLFYVYCLDFDAKYRRYYFGAPFYIPLGLFLLSWTALSFILWRYSSHYWDYAAAQLRAGIYGLSAFYTTAITFMTVLVFGLNAGVIIDRRVSNHMKENYTVRYHGDIRTLSVSGTISDAMKDKAIELLEANPDARFVKINSKGGFVNAGIELGEYLSVHPELEVLVTKECLSSCVTIFFGANTRYMTREAKLGFHRTYALRSRGISQKFSVPQAMERGDNFLIERGVPKKIIDEGNKYGPDKMLYLWAEHLLKLGLITKIVK